MRCDTFPGVSVALRVDKKDLPEYARESDLDRGVVTTSAFLEVLTGTNFDLEVLVDPRYKYFDNDLSLGVSLDGKVARHVLWKARSVPSVVVDGVVTSTASGSTLQRFAFANLETTDETPRSRQPDLLKELGEVTVSLVRCRVTGRTYSQTLAPQSEVVAGVPEKALKGRAISNRTSLGTAEPIAKRTTIDIECPWGTGPIANFTFKYRSRKDLEVEGIIERSPTPVPLEERDPETLTLEESRELVRRMRAREADAVKIKKEVKEEKRLSKRHRDSASVTDDGSGNDKFEDDVTMTASDRSRKRAKIQAIDLT